MRSTGSIQPNEGFAEFLGAFVGDGWIPRTAHDLFILGHPTDDFDYYNEHLHPLAICINPRIKLRAYPYWKVYGISIYETEFVKKLLSFGVTVGKKARTTSLPSWVLDNPSLALAALRGVFDTDGNFCCKKCYGKYDNEFRRKFHCQPQLSISTSSRTLAVQVQTILLDQGFHSENLRIKEVDYSLEPVYVIRLSRLSEIHAWFEEFKLSKNPKHINKFLIWKQYGFCPPKITDQQRKDILSGKISPYSFY